MHVNTNISTERHVLMVLGGEMYCNCNFKSVTLHHTKMKSLKPTPIGLQDFSQYNPTTDFILGWHA